MFGSWTLWVSDWYLSTSRFPKDMHLSGTWTLKLPGRWNWQNWNLKENLQWGWSQKKKVCTGGILLYQFASVPGENLWMGTIVTFLVHQIITFELAVPSQSWCDRLFETRRDAKTLNPKPIVFYNTCWCHSWVFTTPLILWKPDWLNGGKGQELNAEFRNSVFWFPGILK